MRNVLDTNIIVSSYLGPLGAPARIVAAIRLERFTWIYSEELYAEYRKALMYPNVRRRHGRTPAEIDSHLTDLRAFGVLVHPSAVPAVVAADPDDDMVLACALAGDADYIVSGDPHLIDLGEYRNISIVRPAAFLALLDLPH
jgi:uncharacterized protein